MLYCNYINMFIYDIKHFTNETFKNTIKWEMHGLFYATEWTEYVE